MPYMIFGKKGNKITYAHSGRRTPIIVDTKRRANQVVNDLRHRKEAGRIPKGYRFNIKKL